MEETNELSIYADADIKETVGILLMINKMYKLLGGDQIVIKESNMYTIKNAFKKTDYIESIQNMSEKFISRKEAIDAIDTYTIQPQREKVHKWFEKEYTLKEHSEIPRSFFLKDLYNTQIKNLTLVNILNE